MKKLKWFSLYVVTFFVSFVVSMGATLAWPSDVGGIGDVHWNDSVGHLYADIPYGDGPLNAFDLYVPADTTKPTYQLVLYIHAGGFTGGDKADDAMWAKYFVSKGYVGATINYSLRTQADPTATVTKMSLEIKQGVAAIAKEAAQRGYPLDGMMVAGGSAGGTLAMIYAYRDALDSPIPVKAVMQMVGPGSFEPAAWFGLDGSYQSDDAANAGAGFVSMMTGDPITPAMMRDGTYQTALKKISPWALVTNDSVPTLVAYGIHDKVAPFEASKPLLAALDAHNVPHDFIAFSRSGHGLNRDPQQMELLVETINRYLATYLPHDA